jgi:hypothetical protein
MAQRIEVKQTNKFILGLKLEFPTTVRWENGIRPAGFHPENPSPAPFPGTGMSTDCWDLPDFSGCSRVKSSYCSETRMVSHFQSLFDSVNVEHYCHCGYHFQLKE